MKKAIFAVITILILITGVAGTYYSDRNKPLSETTVREQNINIGNKTRSQSSPQVENQPEEEKLPRKVYIDVPFTSQAPFAEW